MSQHYLPNEGSSSSSHRGAGSPSRPSNVRSHTNSPAGRRTNRPSYMHVGGGTTPEHAAALMARLESDSGYGGSGTSHLERDGQTWHPGITEDLPTPGHTPLLPGQNNAEAENERRVMASHIHQLYYNQNRTALGRAINRTVETLKELQGMNSQWPAHYPSVQRTQPPDHSDSPPQANNRPQFSHSSTGLDQTSFRPHGPRRAGTSLGESSSSQESESSVAAERREQPAPRLITPQIAQEFSILKLDLKLGALSQTDLVHSLEKGSIASLLDGKISQSIRHLLALRDRIEDTSSKVLVTGDLNAGKSTFCNALLRRKVLPEDQQPCTSIFCEVVDARENSGVEEVHAIPKDSTYDRNDESTYDVYALQELEKIVVENDKYSQCKVYVKDIRKIDESLLNNGVVDISIIDAPGLNSDSLKTTAVFARQEEIDVVVFVVSAANHFTLSAKDFIWNAAHEKAYIFIVVNGFDNIRDKERCQRMILEQVHNLSPRTFKESAELVHFVSSNAIPVAPALPAIPTVPEGSGSGSGSDPSGDGPSDDDVPLGKHGEPGYVPNDTNSGKGKGKGKEKEKIQDFNNLESALRRFVLEKRARSKLAPAKTYLLNVLSDLNILATVNRDVAQAEINRVKEELEKLEPQFENSKKARSEISENIDISIEETCNEVYTHTRSTLSNTIAHVAEADLGVHYPGFLSAFQYAEDLKTAMLEQISSSVQLCEDHARERSVQGVSAIRSLGLLHLGDEYTDLNFRSDKMFRKKRDALARHVDTEVDFWDFFDVTHLWEKQEKVAGTSMAVTVLGVLGGRALGGVGWVDGLLGAAKVVGSNNLRRMIVPGMATAALLAISYLLHSIPQSLPRRLSTKLAASLSAIDYTHSNATRIASEVRKVLTYPAHELRNSLQRSVEQLGKQKEERTKTMRESQVARKYFGNLVRESEEGRGRVEAVDLENAPGVAGGHDA